MVRHVGHLPRTITWCTVNKMYYYYRYSALGPVWAETRAQSGDWYGSCTLQPRQVLRDRLPLPSPVFKRFHFRHQMPSRRPRREISQRWKLELWARMLSDYSAEMTTSTPFRELWHGNDGFTSPPKEGVLRIFFALKNSTASAGFEPANLGTKGQHATPRPRKSNIGILLYLTLYDFCIDILKMAEVQFETSSVYIWGAQWSSG